MSPAAGAGTNLALRDATALSAVLAHAGPLIPALRSYEQESTTPSSSPTPATPAAPRWRSTPRSRSAQEPDDSVIDQFPV
ncbi:hypothetical protein FXF51_57955 [Nonomuraea sp. PA05]|uniref:hypothetical protein n=1 Tax=Nonomuraea sp. PA05 TaxID=2604466 RepID=UPI0011DA9399|nr:hypothetical protein FXF51_57955 [Nonomuraea sp. PA05]